MRPDERHVEMNDLSDGRNPYPNSDGNTADYDPSFHYGCTPVTSVSSTSGHYSCVTDVQSPLAPGKYGPSTVTHPPVPTTRSPKNLIKNSVHPRRLNTNVPGGKLLDLNYFFRQLLLI